jgi:hypothetical protein
VEEVPLSPLQEVSLGETPGPPIPEEVYSEVRAKQPQEEVSLEEPSQLLQVEVSLDSPRPSLLTRADSSEGNQLNPRILCLEAQLSHKEEVCLEASNPSSLRTRVFLETTWELSPLLCSAGSRIQACKLRIRWVDLATTAIK